jgi:predicted translin family RNA/ssDNA-binding protein
MAIAERGNVILKVRDDEVQRYLQLGYNIVDESGRVIKAAIPTDFRTLQRAYVENTEKIAELENTVAKLTAELVAARAAAKKPAPARKTTK